MPPLTFTYSRLAAFLLFIALSCFVVIPFVAFGHHGIFWITFSAIWILMFGSCLIYTTIAMVIPVIKQKIMLTIDDAGIHDHYQHCLIPWGKVSEINTYHNPDAEYSSTYLQIKLNDTEAEADPILINLSVLEGKTDNIYAQISERLAYYQDKP